MVLLTYLPCVCKYDDFWNKIELIYHFWKVNFIVNLIKQPT